MSPELPLNPDQPNRELSRQSFDSKASDLSGFNIKSDPIRLWVGKFEHAIGLNKSAATLELIRQIDADDSLSAGMRRDIVNRTVDFTHDGVPYSAPILSAYLRKESSPWIEVLRGLIVLGADPNILDSNHDRAVDVVLKSSGNPEVVKTLVDCGALASRQGEQFTIDILPPEPTIPRGRGALKRSVAEPHREVVDFRGLVNEVARLYCEIPDDNRRECREFIKKSGQLYDGYLYLRATEEATLVSPELEAKVGMGRRFLELTALVIAGRHPREIATTIHQIEDLMDNHSHLHHWHQSEPELALLLGHPGMDYTDGDDIDVGNTISRSLTAIHRIYFRGIHQLDPSARETIAKLGFLTHSFKFFRYDTEQQKVWLGDGPAIMPGSSLFERFGFERMPPRTTDRFSDEPKRDHLGVGFVIKPGCELLTAGALARDPNLDPDFHLEFRRAYLLASHPKLGTLLVRNSSPLFGRDTFPNFAYWGPTPSSRGDKSLDLLHPEHMIASGALRPVLTAEGSNYKNVALGMIQSQSVARLVAGLIAVKEGLRRWKFDTDTETAWDVDPRTNQRYPSGSGMHLSDGFQTLVQNLLDRQRFIVEARRSGYEVRERLPDLAFYHPHLPAWHPEKYTFAPRVGGSETTRSRLRLSGDVLSGLQKLADRNLRRSDVATLEGLGVMSFLMAGAQAQAELVMVPPGHTDQPFEP